MQDAVLPTKGVCDHVPPVRGLVLVQNAKGRPFDLIDVNRWVRLNADIFKALKIDVLTPRPDINALGLLLEQASALDVKLSLRTDCSAPPVPLRGLGLHDVFLAPALVDAPHFDAWLNECRDAELPVRLQVQPPFPASPASLVPKFNLGTREGAGMVAVNVALSDPFLPAPRCMDSTASRRTLDLMNELVQRIAARGIEANLLGIPFCLAAKENYPRVLNRRQFFLDHQQYLHMAYDLAVKVFRLSPSAAARALVIPLGKNASMTSFLDHKILPWILDGPQRHVRLLVWRRLTRQLRWVWGRPKPLPESVSAYEREIEKYHRRHDKDFGPVCGRCSLRHICDRKTPMLAKILPGIKLTPQEGEPVASALHFAASRKRYYDAIDRARANVSEHYIRLVEEARNVINNALPTREIDSDDYEIEGQWTHHMPGGNRWYSFTNSEKQSSVLTRTPPPLTVSYTLGGGIAEQAGFSFGRHCKLVCPMEAYSHQITLHVDAEGYYVLLRDGIPVRPTEFDGVQYVPPRLAGMLEPRISLWNIDGAIVTQTVLVWEGRAADIKPAQNIKYSVFIVTSRYARRLQAVLLSLAHQQDFDAGKLEVVIGYIPGLDATDDVIDSMKLSHPQLRIVRAPFSEGYAKSKGFLINESVNLASGEWIVLLDSDTLVAPNMFAKMEQVAPTCTFMAPDGRKLLTPQTTADILLGKIKPWEQWETLLDGPGDFRAREADGVPIGFFQCVRKACMDKVHYMEMDHFEGADWFFGYHIRQEFGMEVRLKGVPVLHLDHGGSQWYGTSKHR